MGQIIDALLQRTSGHTLEPVAKSLLDAAEVKATTIFTAVQCSKGKRCFKLVDTFASLSGPTDLKVSAGLITPAGKIRFKLELTGEAHVVQRDGGQKISRTFLCPACCTSDTVEGIARLDISIKIAADGTPPDALADALGIPVSATGEANLEYKKDIFTYRHSQEKSELVRVTV